MTGSANGKGFRNSILALADRIRGVDFPPEVSQEIMDIGREPAWFVRKVF